MNVIYHDRARKQAATFALLQKATDLLEEKLGQSTEPVSAEWDLAEDATYRPLFTLHLSDWLGAVTAVISPEELQSPSQLNRRFNILLGELLQIRSDKLLQRLIGSGQGSS